MIQIKKWLKKIFIKVTKQNKCAIIQPTKGGFSMHNYAGTKEESESEFIKNYKVDGKEIIIYFRRRS